MVKQPEWSNTPSLDEEMRTPTPREKHLTDLAEKNKDIKPQRYDVKSKNAKALRVVYDFNKQSVAIPPGETIPGVLLHPSAVEYLSRPDSDLELVKAEG
jgi:hypothetical protein